MPYNYTAPSACSHAHLLRVSAKDTVKNVKTRFLCTAHIRSCLWSAACDVGPPTCVRAHKHNFAASLLHGCGSCFSIDSLTSYSQHILHTFMYTNAVCLYTQQHTNVHTTQKCSTKMCCVVLCCVLCGAARVSARYFI